MTLPLNSLPLKVNPFSIFSLYGLPFCLDVLVIKNEDCTVSIDLYNKVLPRVDTLIFI